MIKMNTYTFIRKIHLYAAFSVLGFILMYFVTGFVMTHGNWFSQSKPKLLSKQYMVNITPEQSVEEISNYLQDKLKIRAQRDGHGNNEDGSLFFNYKKPGTAYTVTLSPDSSVAVVDTEEQSASRTIVGFHRLHGYGGGFLYDVYVLMMDLASVATILFGLTGICMWYRLMRKKWMLGIVILFCSIGYTTAVIILFMSK